MVISTKKLSAGSIKHDQHMKAVIIDMDHIKAHLPGYNGKRAEDFHQQSSILAKEAFEEVLKLSKYKEVILMGGGSASGKTEYLSSELINTEAIIFDGTLKSWSSLEMKINLISKYNKTPFLNRDRSFPEEVFFKSHSGCRKSLLQLVKKYPKIDIEIIRNTGDSSTMRKLTFNSLNEKMNLLKNYKKLKKKYNS